MESNTLEDHKPTPIGLNNLLQLEGFMVLKRLHYIAEWN